MVRASRWSGRPSQLGWSLGRRESVKVAKAGGLAWHPFRRSCVDCDAHGRQRVELRLELGWLQARERASVEWGRAAPAWGGAVSTTRHLTSLIGFTGNCRPAPASDGRIRGQHWLAALGGDGVGPTSDHVWSVLWEVEDRSGVQRVARGTATSNDGRVGRFHSGRYAYLPVASTVLRGRQPMRTSGHRRSGGTGDWLCLLQFRWALARCFDVRSESAIVDEQPWRWDGSRPRELSVGRRSLRSSPIDARLVCW